MQANSGRVAEKPGVWGQFVQGGEGDGLGGRKSTIAARERRTDKLHKQRITRESTAALRDWLNENKTNPYPTKMEKILLAFVSKMTYIQVQAEACSV